MARASAIIVTSQRYLDSSSELRDFRSKCHIIPLGLDFDRLANVNKDAVTSLLELYGPNMILGIGRLVSVQGVSYLIRALKEVTSNLVLIGTGPLLNELRATAIDAESQTGVHFLGYVEDINPYLHAAQLFVMPSITRAESFGLVQLEAMNAGLPVINTDLASGVPEVSLNHITGLTVPPKSIAALSRAMNILLRDKNLRLQLGTAGKARAATFSAAAMAENVANLYRDVLEG